MSFVDDLIKRINDTERRLSRIERLDVNPPASSVTKYSGTPVANAIAYWTGAGTVAGARTIYVNSGGSVGFGTATPATPFHLAADAIFLATFETTGATKNAVISFVAQNGKNTNFAFYEGTALKKELRYDATANGFGVVEADEATFDIFIADATGYSGFGNTSPAAQLDVLQATLGSAVQQLASTATNSDPTEIVYQNRVATTDATVTTLHTFTIPASTTYMIVANVVARRTGGSAGTAEDGAGYIVMGVFKNVAGVATSIGSAILGNAAQESQGAWDASFDVTGATARMRVTGAVNNNVVWHMTARVYAVST